MMKSFFYKKVVLAGLGLVLLNTGKTMACDICGCGAGSYYIGILPEFNSKIIGLRYRSSQLTTHLSPGGDRTYLTTDENYYTAELWGGWTIKDRFRIMASVPVSYNTKANETGKESKTGMGDISLQGYYRLLRSKKSLGKNGERLLIQDLWIGGGIKLPTGKYEPKDKSVVSQSTNLFQLGTGSLDFIITGMYDIRLQDLGMNINASYKLNNSNKYDYSYGNRFTGSTQGYYKIRYNNKWMLAPSLGVNIESSSKDLDEGYSVRPTGGYALYGTIGAELNFSKFAIGGNWQPVLSQNLGAGAVKTGNRAMVHFSFLF